MTGARRGLAALAAAGAVLLPMGTPGHAQDFPTKPVRLVIPFPPGGPTDILGRVVAQKLGEQLRENVLPDNRSGAGGNIGLEITARAPADGHTIALTSPTIALSPALYNKLGYDAERELAPVARLASMHNVLVVHPSVPAKSLKEFVALARSHPGKLNYGSGGAGTTNHLANELLSMLTKIKMVHVPYKGATVATRAMLAGEVDQVVVSVPSSLPYIRSNQVRPLALLATERVNVLPDVPTAREAGVPGFELVLWYGIVAPAGVPRPVIDRLARELDAAVKSSDLRERMNSLGIDPWPGTPAQFGELIRAEKQRFIELVKAAGLPKM